MTLDRKCALGNSGGFTCTISGGNPIAEVVWIENGNVIAGQLIRNSVSEESILLGN